MSCWCRIQFKLMPDFVHHHLLFVVGLGINAGPSEGIAVVVMRIPQDLLIDEGVLGFVREIITPSEALKRRTEQRGWPMD